MPARFIDCQLAFQYHLPSVPQGLAVRDRVAAEQHAVDLGAGVFEGEINVAGGLGAAVGDFAGDPDLAELFFQETADVGRQFRDGEDAAAGLAGEKFAAEIPLR